MNAIELNARASIGFDTKLDQTIALLKQAAQDYAPASDGDAPRVSQASSLGAEDMVISHLINSLGLNVGIFVLETGQLHAETLDLVFKLQNLLFEFHQFLDFSTLRFQTHE